MAKLESGQNAPWGEILGELLEGVTHQLSNRVSFFSGIAQIMGSDDSGPPMLRALANEVGKLEEAIRLLRLLGPGEGGTEPSQVEPMVVDAIHLARLHPRAREIAFTLVEPRDIPPVVVQPSEYVHQLVATLVSVVVPGMEGTRVPVEVESDAATVVVKVEGREVRAPVLGAGA